jgi:dipeptidase E
MNSKNRQIIAIGGGGFSSYGKYSPKNLFIEEYILKQTGKTHPAICFIPTASGEAPKYIIDFYRTFSNFDCRTSHFSLFDLPTADIESFFLEKDAIYVGGGNTKSMIALWKEWHLDQHLEKAYENGVILSGISAGANCWFDECITDSIPGTLTPLKCLGFLRGSCCPHYDSEEKRKPSYHSLIQSNQISEGIAIDDHAAVHYINEALVKVVRTNETSGAYLLAKGTNQPQEKRLDALALNT